MSKVILSLRDDLSKENEEMVDNRPVKKNVLNWRIKVGLLTTVLGSAFPSGHSLGVINAPQQVVREWVNSTSSEEYGISLSDKQDATVWGVIVSAFMVGALLGSFLAAPLANNFGRRKALLINHAIFLLSGVMIISCTWSDIIEMLLLGRLFSGLATGIGTSLMPLYLSEIAPPALKGVMGTIFPLGMCAGILISQCLGSASILGTASCWTYLVGGHCFYAASSLLLHPLLPHSPTYLFLIKKDKQAAIKELVNLRNGDRISAMKEASALCEASLIENKNNGFRNVFRNPRLRRPLICVIGLNAGQQFVGINAVFYYSTLVFSKAGLEIEESQMAAVVAGVANFLMSGLALPLIRFIRRRILLLTSLLLYIVSLLFLIISLYLVSWYPWAVWIAFASLFVSVLSYGMGLGPVPYMIGTEIFPADTRSIGLAIGSASNWGSNLLVGLLFPLLQNLIGFYSFIVFIFIGFFFFFFIFILVPETYRAAGVQSTNCTPNTTSGPLPGYSYSPSNSTKAITEEDCK